MNLEQIHSAIKVYDKLVSLVYDKVKFMSSISSNYSTNRGINDICFEEDQVQIVYNSSYRGYSDQDSFEFPITWLALNDEELKDVIEKKNQEEERIKLEREEARKKLEKEAKEKKERLEYERLKDKFEKLYSNQ
jgi:hypothetical protein